MRVPLRIMLLLSLALVAGRARGDAPRKLAYDKGVRGLKQRWFGKTIVDGNVTHFYLPGKTELRLDTTQTVEVESNRTITTTLHLRPMDQRMTVAQAKAALGGVLEGAYLYRVDAAGLRALALKSEIVERVSQRDAHDRFTTTRYQLQDGVIEQWTNSTGTTFRTP
jgi:hypothetical protein